mgnify:CR=1 FL=1
MDKIFDDCSEVSYVYVDGFASVRRAVRYLYNQGHRRIGYILNTEDISVIQERYLGYLKGLEDCGLEADEKWIYALEYHLILYLFSVNFCNYNLRCRLSQLAGRLTDYVWQW